MKTVPFAELIEANLLQDPDWGPFARGQADIPKDRPQSAHLMATYLFYLGEYRKGREAANLFAEYSQSLWEAKPADLLGAPHLFRAALFWSLAGEQDHAQKHWSELVRVVRAEDERRVISTNHAQSWLHAAYAEVRLGVYDGLDELADKGRRWLDKGKGTFKAPHRNSLAYSLGPLLKELAGYLLDSNAERKLRAQRALTEYKRENRRFGRHGYAVIFDLQFGYAHVFDPVLPGPERESD